MSGFGSSNDFTNPDGLPDRTSESVPVLSTEAAEQPKVSLYEILTDVQRDAEWREARDEQRKALADQRVAHAEWQKALAWQSDVFLLIADCLVTIASDMAPDGGQDYSHRLAAARAALTSEAHRG